MKYNIDRDIFPDRIMTPYIINNKLYKSEKLVIPEDQIKVYAEKVDGKISELLKRNNLEEVDLVEETHIIQLERAVNIIDSVTLNYIQRFLLHYNDVENDKLILIDHICLMDSFKYKYTFL